MVNLSCATSPFLHLQEGCGGIFEKHDMETSTKGSSPSPCAPVSVFRFIAKEPELDTEHETALS